MDTETDSELLHRQALRVLCRRLLQLVVLLDGLLQVSEDMTRLALVEGRGNIGDEATVRATLSHHALPDIPDRIIVEVWVRCDKCFTPVIGAECDLLLRGELQAPMRTEVHQGICPEDVASPEVSIDIGIRGRRSGTVHDSEVVTTDTRYRLRE